MTRLFNDAYYTPQPIFNWLRDQLKLENKNILDPCCGFGFPTQKAFGGKNSVVNCDIDLQPFIQGDYPLPDCRRDMTLAVNWWYINFSGGNGSDVDWTITNPPYKRGVAEAIVKNALNYSTQGVAMLLRLSWLEPVKSRRLILRKSQIGLWGGKSLKAVYPVNPRPRFDQGKNGTDNQTVAWFIWATPEVELKPFDFCLDWDKW